MTAARSGPAFSLHDIPFSTHGSWFGISPVLAEKTRADDLHLVSHQNGMHAVLGLVPLDAETGLRVESRVEATPGLLRWVHGRGSVHCAYESPDTLRLRGEGLGLRITAAAQSLTPFTGTYFYRDPVDGSHVFTSYETGRRYRITVLSGVVAQTSGSQSLGDSDRGITIDAGHDEVWEMALEELDTARRPYVSSGPFSQVVAEAEGAFAQYVDAVAPWRSPRTPAAELAAYVLWSATVAPAGLVTRPAVLMSKHWMDKVWSWDHCFNALALARGLPELAWDQFLVPFDHQDESGALPDSVTHSEVLRNFVKPPIHGWTLTHLRRRLPRPLGPAELAETYDRLRCWTDFWLTARRAPDSVLPYYQHGNDSGWDNATTFDPERVVVTADLAAFLILQLHELARLAAELDLPDEARHWVSTAEATQTAMLDELWTGERFVTKGSRQRGDLEQFQPARADADRTGGAPARGRRQGPRRPDRLPPDPVRPGHRTAHLTALPLRRLLARPDLGTSHRPDRGRPAPRRPPSPRRRDQRPLQAPVRNPRLRRELRRPHRQGAARPRVHLDGGRLSPSRRGP
jgi:hypothetical protein